MAPRKKADDTSETNKTQPDTSGFGWAVNLVKLNRAKAHVNATAPGLKGADFEDAVKERYIALGGLVSGEAPVRQGKSTAREENIAANDGSPD